MKAKRSRYALGLDFGTNSVRALIVDVKNGHEIGTAVHDYVSGEAGIILDDQDPNLARQDPAEYVKGLAIAVGQATAAARRADRGFDPKDIIGIGVDTTGSTPLPVDREGTPLAMQKEFRKNPNAMAWLWKDHTGYAEAAEITALAATEHPEYLAKCGGTYSSEWFFSKILHCLRTDPQVFDAAYSWVEHCRLDPGRPDRNDAARAHEEEPLRRRPQGHVQRRLGRLPGQGVSRQARSPSSGPCGTGSSTRLTPSTTRPER